MKNGITIVSAIFLLLGFGIMAIEWFVLKTQVFQLFAAGIVAVVVGAVLLLYLYIPPLFGRSDQKADDPQAELRDLLAHGVKFEDEFIETYMKFLRDEGFMLLFGQRQTEAKQVMDSLISESQFHKTSLETIIANLNKEKAV